MIRQLILTLLGVFAAATAIAAPAQRLVEGEVLRGRFVQERHLHGFAAPLRSEGHFVLAPGRGLIWKTEKPFAVTTTITADGLAQEVNGNKTLSLPAAKVPFLSRLYHMLGGALGGDWTALEDDFVVARNGNDERWEMTLVPRRPDNLAMPFRIIAVAGQRFVDEVTLTKPDGDYDKLTFLDQILSAGPLADDEAAAMDSLSR